MQYTDVTTDRQLAELCGQLAAAERIAFDTEFVSERTYRPQLCLVQVAAAGRLAVIDSLAVGDMTPFWQLLADGDHETIVHAGREELVFSLAAVGRRPQRLADVQIAAGMVGHEYPAGYGSLVSKVLGQRIGKGETRTDWQKRPLSKRQIEYALSDVVHLEAVRDALEARLRQLDRAAWFRDEMTAWQEEVEQSLTRDRWRRVSRVSGLSPRALAIVREVWHWRDREAERRDSPPRFVLRDDLLVEIARRGVAEPERIQAIRGMQRGDLNRALPKLAACVRRALALPEEECPRSPPRDSDTPGTQVCQFLFSALGSICRSAHVAPSIVGSMSDVRDLVAYHLGMWDSEDGRPPALARGWRAQIVGDLIEELLDGKQSIRIHDPRSDQPLVFEPRRESGT